MLTYFYHNFPYMDLYPKQYTERSYSITQIAIVIKYHVKCFVIDWMMAQVSRDQKNSWCFTAVDARHTGIAVQTALLSLYLKVIVIFQNLFILIILQITSILEVEFSPLIVVSWCLSISEEQRWWQFYATRHSLPKEFPTFEWKSKF